MINRIFQYSNRESTSKNRGKNETRKHNKYTRTIVVITLPTTECNNNYYYTYYLCQEVWNTCKFNSFVRRHGYLSRVLASILVGK